MPSNIKRKINELEGDQRGNRPRSRSMHLFNNCFKMLVLCLLKCCTEASKLRTLLTTRSCSSLIQSQYKSLFQTS